MNQKAVSELLKAVLSLARTTDQQSALNLTVEGAGELVEGKDVSVWLIQPDDPDAIECRASYRSIEEYKNKTYSRIKSNGKYHGLTAWVFGEGKPLRLDNVTDERELRQKCPETIWSDSCGGFERGKEEGEAVKRPMLAVPLKAIDPPDQVIGVLRVGSSKGSKLFSEEDETILTLFATQLSFVISYTQRKQRAESLLALLFNDLRSIPNPENLLDRAVEAFPKLFAGSFCTVLMKDERELFDLVASSAQHLKSLIGTGQFQPYRQGEGKTGTAISERKALLVNTTEKDTLSSDRPRDQWEVLDGAASLMVAPLYDSGGSVIGLIRSARGRNHPCFSHEDLELFEFFAKQISYLLSVVTVGPFFPSRNVYELIERFNPPRSKELTVLYLDLDGFTQFSNQVLEGNAAQIVETLNCFFNVIVPVIYSYGGTVDKFEGDGLIALFNGYTACDDHALSTIKCALELRKRFKHFTEKFLEMQCAKFGRQIKRESLNYLGVKIGVATSTDVIVGAVGATHFQRADGTRDSRVEFTIIGQDVNLGARLVREVPKEIEGEKDSRSCGTLILIDHKTWNSVEKYVETKTHWVTIRGAGPDGKEKRIVYEVLQPTSALQ